jgi:hypothetical protein
MLVAMRPEIVTHLFHLHVTCFLIEQQRTICMNTTSYKTVLDTIHVYTYLHFYLHVRTSFSLKTVHLL